VGLTLGPTFLDGIASSVAGARAERTITGTAADDDLTGTTWDDVICMRAGQDTDAFGEEGNDIINGTAMTSLMGRPSLRRVRKRLVEVPRHVPATTRWTGGREHPHVRDRRGASRLELRALAPPLRNASEAPAALRRSLFRAFRDAGRCLGYAPRVHIRVRRRLRERGRET
jgi:hypothetical protein